MFPFFSQFLRNREAGLSKAELELIGLLRLAPSEPLTGKDLVLAQAMVGKGLLKPAGPRRFVLTEKASVSYRKRI